MASRFGTLVPGIERRRACRRRVVPAYRGRVVWFFRAIEAGDGSWACSRGGVRIDAHSTLADAVSHLETLSRADGPAQLFAHWTDGRVEALGEVTDAAEDDERP